MFNLVGLAHLIVQSPYEIGEGLPWRRKRDQCKSHAFLNKIMKRLIFGVCMRGLGIAENLQKQMFDEVMKRRQCRQLMNVKDSSLP